MFTSCTAQQTWVVGLLSVHCCRVSWAWVGLVVEVSKRPDLLVDGACGPLSLSIGEERE